MNNSKINAFFDWVWRILVLNLLSLIITALSCAILFFPCYVATFRTLKKIDDNVNENIFKMFFKSMIEEWKKMLILTIIFDLLVLLFIFNFLAYIGFISEDPSSVVVFILFISTIFIAFIFIAIMVQLPLVICYFKLKTWHTIKMSIYMAGRYFAITGIGLLLIAASVFMAMKMLVAWCFIGISLPIFFIFRFASNNYRYLSKNLDDIKESENYELNGEEEEENK